MLVFLGLLKERAPQGQCRLPIYEKWSLLRHPTGIDSGIDPQVTNSSKSSRCTS